jgi:hypothetical protein
MKIMVAAHTAAIIDTFIFAPQGTNRNDSEIVADILTFSGSDKKVTADLLDLQPFLRGLVIVFATPHVVSRTEEACLRIIPGLGRKADHRERQRVFSITVLNQPFKSL